MRGVIADHIEPFDPNDEQQRLYRVAEATYLMWMSPEFAVQRRSESDDSMQTFDDRPAQLYSAFSTCCRRQLQFLRTDNTI